jgi:hypothetical protein
MVRLHKETCRAEPMASVREEILRVPTPKPSSTELTSFVTEPTSTTLPPEPANANEEIVMETTAESVARKVVDMSLDGENNSPGLVG